MKNLYGPITKETLNSETFGSAGRFFASFPVRLPLSLTSPFRKGGGKN